MPSAYEDPSTWRFFFRSSPANIPVRLVSRTGDFEQTATRITETYLMQSVNLLRFATDTFPPSFVRGDRIIQPPSRHVSGLPSVRASKISWQEHIPGLPVDPFSSDPIKSLNASDLTYPPVSEVTVEYTTSRPEDEFLELFADTAGEIISQPSPKGTYEGPGGSTDREANRQPSIQFNKIVPMTDWTARYPRVPYSFFRETLIGTIRSLLGKVNSSVMPVLFDAPVETILFVGYKFEQEFSLRVNQPLMSRVEFKLLEKRVYDGYDSATLIKGHNHYWNPDKGQWQKLLFGDDLQPAFELDDLNDLFFLDVNEPDDEETAENEFFEFNGPPIVNDAA